MGAAARRARRRSCHTRPDQSGRTRPEHSQPQQYHVRGGVRGRHVLLPATAAAATSSRGLVRRGLMPKDGVFHVDVMKVPHHGSARNVSRKFFSQVTADTYVFRPMAPMATLTSRLSAGLSPRIKEQRRKAKLIFTNATPTVAGSATSFASPLRLHHRSARCWR